MSRTARLLLIIYAIAMLVQAAGSYAASPSGFWNVWTFSGAVSVAYLAIALGYFFSKRTVAEPSIVWLAVAGVFTFSLWVQQVLDHSFPTANGLTDILQFFGPFVFFIAASASIYYGSRGLTGPPNTPRRRTILLAVWAVGACLVLWSLVLGISGDATGLQVILRKAPWITQFHNVAGAESGPNIQALQPIFGNAGYTLYLLALLLTVLVALWLAVALISLKGWQSSRALACSAAAFTFLAFWIYTDTFWGWHSLVHQSLWSAWLGTAHWLAAPLFVLLFLAPIALRAGETARLRSMLILQFPIAAFNFAVLPTYFSRDSYDPHLPGLGVLIIGLQFQSWACFALLLLPASEANTPS